MADDITLRLGAQAQQAIDQVQKVQSTLAGMLSTVKSGAPIYDQFGNVAASATAKAGQGYEKAAKGIEILGGAFGKLVGAFSAASLIDRGVSSLMKLGTEAIASASHILDLKDQTGLATDTLQRFAYIEERTGTSTDALANAAFKLGLEWSKNREAVEALGLNYDELSAKSPEDKFIAVTSRLAGMTDAEERNRLAVELLGKTWKEVAPAAVAGIEKIGQAAHVSSEAQLKAVSDATAAWRGFVANMKSTATDALGYRGPD